MNSFYEGPHSSDFSNAPTLWLKRQPPQWDVDMNF